MRSSAELLGDHVDDLAAEATRLVRLFFMQTHPVVGHHERRAGARLVR